MRNNSFGRFLLGCGIAAFVSLPLVGCGGADMEPQGPEMGELEKYLNENPELLETSDEEMDMVEGDEFGDPEG